MRFLTLFGVAGSMMILAFAATSQAADPSSPAAAPRGGAQIPANGGRITLEVNKGTLVRLSGPAATVFVANPEIADVQVKSPTLVYISAKAPGETVIYAVDASDSVLMNASILVEHDISRLRSSLQQLAPGEQVSAASVDGNLVLSGVVSDAGKADKVRALAASVAGEAKGSQVINRMTVATPNQVNLQVRIAEVQVNKLNDIGVNWQKIGSELSFMTNNPVTIMGELTNTLRVGHLGGEAVRATIDALTQEGFITDLAEPNLTAMSGQTASFLAGGEFPVPINGSSAATGGFPTITVEFKSFGVSLAFTPTVIDAQHLNLRVRPEVSQLSTVGAVSVPLTATASVTIPALTVRRAETSIELGSGETPYLVQPSQTRLAAPTDGLRFPNDAQRVLLSNKFRQGPPGPGPGPLNAGGRGLIGPGGFRLD